MKIPLTRILLVLFMVTPFLLCAGVIEQDIKHMKETSNHKVTWLDAHTVGIENTSGGVKYVDISDQGNAFGKSPDMQVFDLTTIPDSLYAFRYRLKGKVAIGSAEPYPLLFGDFNRNGRANMVGLYKNVQDGEIGQAGIMELQDDSTFVLRHLYNYMDSSTTPIGITDVNRDGLVELNIRRGQDFWNYKSPAPDSLPIQKNFNHVMWQFSGMVGSEIFGDFDKDSLTDVFYVGDDTLSPWGNKVYIAEYDPSVNNFVQKYRFPPPEWNVGGSSAGDFDDDGFMELVTGSIHGDVYIMENNANDSYTNTFTTSVHTSNAYLNCATNDIDRDGKGEFFIGASSYWNGVSGTKVFWFEATGDNTYEVKRTFFLSGTGVLGTTVLYSYDVNADAVDDLVFVFQYHVVALVWNNNLGLFDMYYFYHHPINNGDIQSAKIFDVFNDGNPNLFISIYDWNRVPVKYSLWFIPKTITSINRMEKLIPKTPYLAQNYPNPFNGSTKISFSLRKYSTVNLLIYNYLGKEVRKLISNHGLGVGEHGIVWDGKDSAGREVASGVYIYKLTTENSNIMKKIIYLK